VSTIEQINCRMPRQLDCNLWKRIIGRNNQRKGQGKKMEEHRCRMVATVVEDYRCKSLLGSAQVVTQDPRYKCLHRRVDVQVEDSRCSTVLIEMVSFRQACVTAFSSAC